MGLGQCEQGVKRRRPRLARCYIRYICRDPESIPWLIWRDPESILLLLVVAGRRQLGARFPPAAPFGSSRRGNGLPGSSHGTYRQMT